MQFIHAICHGNHNRHGGCGNFFSSRLARELFANRQRQSAGRWFDFYTLALFEHQSPGASADFLSP